MPNYSEAELLVIEMGKLIKELMESGWSHCEEVKDRIVGLMEKLGEALEERREEG